MPHLAAKLLTAGTVVECMNDTGLMSLKKGLLYTVMMSGPRSISVNHLGDQSIWFSKI